MPPQSEEAELAVLGSILIDNEAMLAVSDFLKPDHFYFPNHSLIYETMLYLYENRSAIDIVTVAERLKEAKKLTKVGGKTYLAKLANEVPTSANVESYGQIIKSLSAKRELITAAAKISESAFSATVGSNQLLDMAEQEIFALTERHIRNKPISIREVLTSSFDRLDELQKMGDGLRGIPSGFKSLDDTLAGMQNSNLIVLASRPGVGKTAFALNIARYVAVEKNLPVCIFSLEMSKEELVDRLLVRQGLIDSWKLKTGRLSDTDFAALSEAMGVLAEAPLFIDDTPGLTVTEVRTKARRLQVERDIKLIIVDYLQLMHGQTKDNRVQEVSEISQGLKNLARELKIPVLAAAQLSRAMEARGGRPRLSDLRESGCLTGETLITLTNGKQSKIEDLVGKKNVKVLALEKNLQIVPVDVGKIFYSGKKQVFELLLKSGRKIKASANHPFRKLEGWQRLDELKLGDRVAVPRIIRIDGKKPVNRNKLILLAHLIGDGCYLEKQPLHYTNSDRGLLDIVEKVATAEFAVRPRRVKQQNWFHLYLPAVEKLARGKRNPIVKWLDEELHIFDQRSGEKIIPEFVFGLDKKALRLFLSHLWATDGCIWINGEKSKGPVVKIYYASKSKEMIYQIYHLLLRLGIVSKINFSKKGDYDETWQVHIQGKINQELFLSKVGCVGRKVEKVKTALSVLGKIESNPNNDVIPKEVWQLIEYERKKRGWSSREFHKKMGWAYSGTQRHGNGVGRDRLTRIGKVFGGGELVDLSRSDVFWDEVKEIKSLGLKKVYDMTVPRVNNFVANDIVVHNSIEQDADVVMFLHRPEDENRESVSCSIAKHRNGPVGEFNLYFNGKQISFFDMDTKREE